MSIATELEASEAGPRSATEAILADIWRQALGPKGRGAAHILHAPVGLRRLVRFVREAESAFGMKIPPTALMRLGTIERMAAAIEREEWPEPTPLALLRDGAPGDALYVIAAGSGLVLELCDLALLIDFPGQIWALQLPGLDGEAEPLTSIEAIAEHYAAAVAARGAAGASHMIGYSFGGIVVVEMARILRRRGCEVGLVGLLDSTVYEKYWPKRVWLRTAALRAWRRLSEVRRMPPAKAAGHIAGRVAGAARHFRRRIAKTAQDGSSGQSIYYIGGLEPDFQRVRDHAIVAFESHRPASLACPAVLFKSRLGDPHACDPEGLWRPLIQPLEIVHVPGSHTTMVRKPFANTLAREISARLRTKTVAELSPDR